MILDGSNCPENENSTDCLLRNLLKVIGSRAEAEENEVNWDPITFAFTVPVGVFGILAAVFALVTIFQGVLASGRGRRKSSKHAIGKWSKQTKKRWNWHELNRLSIAQTPILQTKKMLALLDGNGSDVSNQESDDMAESSSAATWLAFLNEVGLQNLNTSEDTVRNTPADYLPDDLQAVPAYGEVGCIVAMAAAAGVHTLKMNPDSMYPIIIGYSFQFDFRQHPILGTVGAFARYDKTRAPSKTPVGTPNERVTRRTTGTAPRTITGTATETANRPRTGAKAKERVWLALLHAGGNVEANPTGQGLNAPKKQPVLRPGHSETPDANGNDVDTEVAMAGRPQRPFLNALRARFDAAIMGDLTCDGHICRIGAISSRQDNHNILWLVTADTPSQVPAIFPSRSTGVERNLSIFALQSKFWSTPRADLLSQVEPTILDLDQDAAAGHLRGFHLEWTTGSTPPLLPAQPGTHLSFSINVFQACLRFLYSPDAFDSWFSGHSSDEKADFREQMLQQLRNQDTLLNGYPKTKVACGKMRLFLNTLGLLDLEQSIKDHTARFLDENELEFLTKGIGRSIPEHDILGQHKELVAGLSLVASGDAGINGLLYCVLGNDPYITPLLTHAEAARVVQSLCDSFTGHPGLILACLKSAGKSLQQSDEYLQPLHVYLENHFLGPTGPHADVSTVLGMVRVLRRAWGGAREGDTSSQERWGDVLADLYRLGLTGYRTEEDILHDVLVWRVIMLAMLFWLERNRKSLTLYIGA